jgi:hypothetical protein
MHGGVMPENMNMIAKRGLEIKKNVQNRCNNFWDL